MAYNLSKLIFTYHIRSFDVFWLQIYKTFHSKSQLLPKTCDSEWKVFDFYSICHR